VVKTQGRHGEVAVELHTDVPDRFKVGMQLSALTEDGVRRDVEIEALWPHKNWLIAKFAGIDSIADAESFIGSELQVGSESRAELESGWTFVSDLIGCVVLDNAHEIGMVQDVQFGAGEAPLLVVKAGGGTHEIPYAEAFLVKVDLDQRRIEMNLPEGLLDINAPLTAEEKREQAEIGKRTKT
jgi:16S rRNA processing protein RimM